MKITNMILIISASLILNGCASTLAFLFDVDPNLTYNDQEKKWEQRRN